MAEATGRNHTEPGHSGELQEVGNPNLLRIKAPLVQAEEVGTTNAAAERSRQVKDATGTIASAVPGEVQATGSLQNMTTIPVSGLVSNAARGAPPTEATTSGDESVLAQQSHHSDLGIMATAASPEAAADETPLPDQGDEVEVDADVSPSIDEAGVQDD
jgi:hypothetical protein